MKHFWQSWVVYGLKCGCAYVLYATLAWVFISYYGGQSYSGIAWLYTSLFFFAVGLFMPVYYFIRVGDKRETSPDIGEVWTCRVTEEGWSFQRKNGLLRFIPWTLMTLKYEHPEGWLVDCGGEQIWVYRQPLRDNGLEEIFRSKL